MMMSLLLLMCLRQTFQLVFQGLTPVRYMLQTAGLLLPAYLTLHLKKLLLHKLLNLKIRLLLKTEFQYHMA